MFSNLKTLVWFTALVIAISIGCFSVEETSKTSPEAAILFLFLIFLVVALMLGLKEQLPTFLAIFTLGTLGVLLPLLSGTTWVSGGALLVCVLWGLGLHGMEHLLRPKKT